MKKNIFLIIISIFLVGCAEVDLNQVSDSDLERISEKALICNSPYIRVGIECCLDQNSNNICDKDEILKNNNLEDLTEYKQFIEAFNEETKEYENEKLNYDLIKLKINKMNRSLSNIDDTKYNISIEKIFLKYRYERLDWNLEKLEIQKEIEYIETEDEEKMIFEKYLNLYKKELIRLEKYSDSEKYMINTKFNYDIFEKIEGIKIDINKKEKILSGDIKGENEEILTLTIELENKSKEIVKLEEKYVKNGLIYYDEMLTQELNDYLRLLDETEIILTEIIKSIISNELELKEKMSQLVFEESLQEYKEYNEEIKDTKFKIAQILNLR